jgi:hypothetical protein
MSEPSPQNIATGPCIRSEIAMKERAHAMVKEYQSVTSEAIINHVDLVLTPSDTNTPFTCAQTDIVMPLFMSLLNIIGAGNRNVETMLEFKNALEETLEAYDEHLAL